MTQATTSCLGIEPTGPVSERQIHSASLLVIVRIATQIA
jgi:hypothetical protein